MPIDKGIHRIIDANINRSREGLRVCEDIARFMMDSKSITLELKSVRHDITAILNRSHKTKNILINSRNCASDMGRTPRPEIEVERKDAVDIFLANIERVKESIRVLEEFFKLIDAGLSAKLSQLRFKTYEIEKKAFKRLSSLRYSR